MTSNIPVLMSKAPGPPNPRISSMNRPPAPRSSYPSGGVNYQQSRPSYYPPLSGPYQPSASTIADEKYPPLKPAEKRYCWGRLSKNGCIGWTMCCILTWVGIALILFFCIPREPTFDAYGLAYTNSTTVKLVNGGPYISFNLGANVSFVSPSYIPVTVSGVDVTGSPLVNGLPSKTLKVNGSLDSVYLPPNTNVSAILPMQVVYSASSVGAALDDPFWVNMLESCGLVPFASSRPLTFQYTASGSLKGLEFIRVSQSGTYTFKCQIDANNVTSIFGSALSTLGLMK